MQHRERTARLARELQHGKCVDRLFVGNGAGEGRVARVGRERSQPHETGEESGQCIVQTLDERPPFGTGGADLPTLLAGRGSVGLADVDRGRVNQSLQPRCGVGLDLLERGNFSVCSASASRARRAEQGFAEQLALVGVDQKRPVLVVHWDTPPALRRPQSRMTARRGRPAARLVELGQRRAACCASSPATSGQGASRSTEPRRRTAARRRGGARAPACRPGSPSTNPAGIDTAGCRRCSRSS